MQLDKSQTYEHTYIKIVITIAITSSVHLCQHVQTGVIYLFDMGFTVLPNLALSSWMQTIPLPLPPGSWNTGKHHLPDHCTDFFSGHYPLTNLT